MQHYFLVVSFLIGFLHSSKVHNVQCGIYEIPSQELLHESNDIIVTVIFHHQFLQTVNFFPYLETKRIKTATVLMGQTLCDVK